MRYRYCERVLDFSRDSASGQVSISRSSYTLDRNHPRAILWKVIMSPDLFLVSEASILCASVIKFIVPELDPPIIVPPSDPPTVPGFPGIENPEKPDVPQRDPPPPQPDINIPAPNLEDPVPPQIPPGPAYASQQRPIRQIRKPRDVLVIQRFLETRKSNLRRAVN
jgi:hypothetical protein